MQSTFPNLEIIWKSGSELQNADAGKENQWKNKNMTQNIKVKRQNKKADLIRR